MGLVFLICQSVHLSHSFLTTTNYATQTCNHYKQPTCMQESHVDAIYTYVHKVQHYLPTELMLVENNLNCKEC